MILAFNIQNVLIGGAFVGVLGLVLGVALGIIGKVFFVKVDECLVLRIGTQQLKAHLLAAAHVGGALSTEAVKHDEDGVGMCGQQAVGMVEHRGGTAIGAAKERQHH